MAWHDTSVGVYYRYGSQDAYDNADEIYNYFRGLSSPWTVESISALCGNIQLESQMNPYVRETTTPGAFGLVQWITYKSSMISWAQNNGLRATSGPAQVQYLEYERSINEQWLKRAPYSNVSFSDFAYNTQGYSVAELSRIWWNNFERSKEYQPDRTVWSNGYYQHFTGSPPGPGPGPGGIDTWLYYQINKRRFQRADRTIFI